MEQTYEMLPGRSKTGVYAPVSDVSQLDETHDTVNVVPGKVSGYHHHEYQIGKLPQGLAGSTEALHPSYSTTTDREAWRPGIFRRIPWLGMVSLTVPIICMAVSIGVLTRSNGQLVTTWRVQPTVILAVASAAANVALSLALAQGVTVSWWYKALRGGTVADLHRYWNFGGSLWASITAGRHFNNIALASIVVTCAVFDGPLLQRASTIVPKDISEPISIDASIAQQLPKGYTSTMLGRIEYPVVLTQPFAEVLQDYSSRVPITTDFKGCVGKCETVVRAAGFSIDCQPPKKTPADYNGPTPLPDGSLPPSAFDPQPIFTVTFTWSPGVDKQSTSDKLSPTPEQLLLSVASTDTVRCVGSFVTKTCTLREAVVDYQLSLVNDTVVLTNPNVNLNVVSMGNSTPEVHGYSPGEDITLGGFALAGKDLFSSNTSLRFVGAAGLWEVAGFNTFASRYIVDPQYRSNCQFSWRDPTSDILMAIHEIMFRTALKATSLADSVLVQNEQGNETFLSKQTLQAKQTSVQNVYSSHFGYLYGALALITLGILSVLPTFDGFWHLGRTVTLSPLETAKAFNAPMLSNRPSHSNAKVEQLMKNIGGRTIRYGEVTISMPANSHDVAGTGMMRAEKTLEMARPEYVIRPRKGTKFDA